MHENHPTEAQFRQAEELLRQTRANDELAPVDCEAFWADEDIAGADPFGDHIPQCAMGIRMSGECVYDELGIPEDYWRYGHDPQWRLQLHRDYNDKAEQIVGRRLLPEGEPAPADRRYPPVKGLPELFECETVWRSGSWWIEPAVHSEAELAALLDRVEARLDDPRACFLPENWDAEKTRLQALNVQPPLYRHQRGPVTFATSACGTEDFIFLLHDNPDLAIRLRDAICHAMLARIQLLDREAGYAPGEAPRGFSFADDNCCLLTPRMYELFGYPILEAVFSHCAPDPGDWRFQHSDSPMAHLLPILARLDFSAVNLGPEVKAADIRYHMPRTSIHGQLAPFTFSRHQQQRIVAEFLRDFEATRDTRGLVFATAGSINNGSRLAGLRLIMAAVQRYGRF